MKALSFKQRVLCYLIITSCFVLSQIFFEIAGSMDMGTQFGSQVIFLFLASASFLAASFGFWRLSLRPKWLFWPLPPLVLSVLLYVAYATTPRSPTMLSQQYNIILLWLISLLQFGVVFAIYALSKTKYSIEVIGVAILSIVLYVLLESASLKANFHSGLFGDVMESNSYCTLPSATPWIGLLPPRAANFFMGSLKCPKVKELARLQGGTLVVFPENCPKHELMTVDINPDMLKQRPPEDLSRRREMAPKPRSVDIKRSSRRQEIPLADDVEHVSVHCGAHENFFIVNRPKRSVKSRPSLAPADDTPNVLVLMIDAFSRQQLLRKMPSTCQFLSELHEGDELSVFQFFRYSTVGHSTSFNLVPMVCGKAGPEACATSAGPAWNELRERKHFATAMVVNQCEDYYEMFGSADLRLDYDVVTPFCHFEYDQGGQWSNFAGPYSMNRRCITGKHVHQHTLDYIEQFFDNHDAGRFMFASFCEAHEGSHEVIASADNDLSAFLRRMKEKKHLSNTITMLVSDHGNHMGPYWLFSEAGKLERTTPLLDIIVPNQYLEKHPNMRRNLLLNQQRLFTPFDIHATLRHIASYSDSEKTPSTQAPAISLFDEIPADRSCSSARIPDSDCFCLAPDTPVASSTS